MVSTSLSFLKLKRAPPVDRSYWWILVDVTRLVGSKGGCASASLADAIHSRIRITLSKLQKRNRLENKGKT